MADNQEESPDRRRDEVLRRLWQTPPEKQSKLKGRITREKVRFVAPLPRANQTKAELPLEYVDEF
jgi:hypothetical protein